MPWWDGGPSARQPSWVESRSVCAGTLPNVPASSCPPVLLTYVRVSVVRLYAILALLLLVGAWREQLPVLHYHSPPVHLESGWERRSGWHNA